MKLIGLCCFFDEPPEFLQRMVKSAAAAGVDTIVAVDGAYALLPGGQPSSDPKQAKALLSAARAAGVRLVLDTPNEVWESEVAKRNHLFALALTVAEQGRDWLFVCDADYEVKANRDLFLAKLLTVDTDVASVLAYTPPGPNGSVTFGPPERTEFRALFRAQKITLRVNHWSYFAEDGRRLWGSGLTELAPATDLSGIVGFTHWTYFRPKARIARQFDYYRARDKAQIERAPCTVCGETLSTVTVPYFVRDDEGNVEAALRETCDDCYGIALREAQQKAADWNLEELVASQTGT